MIQTGMRVLFIGPKTFDYEKEIKLELERAGCHVDLYDDRPASTPLVKALIRFRPELIASICDAYFDRIIFKKCAPYDVVFIIKGEAISAQRLQMLRKAQPNARFLYYTWDSLGNYVNTALKLSYFDKAYSFDRHDSIANPNVKHLPLFYLDAYAELNHAIDVFAEKSDIDKNDDIDILFLGSIHSDRHAVVDNILRSCKAVLPAVTLWTHFYYQSKWVFVLRKLFDRNFRSIPWADVRWNSLGKAEILSLFSRSKIILDIQHPGQTGLTMRTIECLGAGKKLITTNLDVMKYDFYRSENILVVDRFKPVVTREFMILPFKNLPPEIYERYSLKNWLNEIFS